jgi:adenylate cyclase
LMLFIVNMGYGFFVEARGKRQITGLFGQYVPPELVDEMAKDPGKFSMRGESRDMTVLFTDIRDFTSIAERLDPETLSQLMNEFFTPLTEIIQKYRGTIDKYMGDCIMAFWGAPVKDPLHARNAVLAALEMQRAVGDMHAAFKARNWPEIRIGIGVNSGRMSVGNMGSRVRLAYTVVGDAVNLASRLEGVTKEYGVAILVGEDTKRAVTNISFREIDRVRLKGKDTAIAIFEPLGAEDCVTGNQLEEVRGFAEALNAFRAQDWQGAEQQLIVLKKRFSPAHLYEVFLERIAVLRKQPPGPTWDGAFTFQTK